jgi:hypothetical protein
MTLSDHDKWGGSRYFEELVAVLALALPAIATMGCREALTFTSQISIGHLGIKQLAAAAIGNTVGDQDQLLPCMLHASIQALSCMTRLCWILAAHC